ATATTTVRAEADLSITKTDSPDPVRPGGSLTYTVSVTNGGPNAAASVTMNDPLPALTTFQSETHPAGWTCTTPAVGSTGTVSCTTASLASGATATFTIVVQVSPSTPDGTTISNTASVTSTTSDPNLLNNTATATTTVRAEADLSITKTDSPDPVRPGGSLTYTVSVTNGGPNAAASVTMNDPLPALTTFQSETHPAGWTCTTPAVGSTGTVSCTTASLASGATATFTIVVQVSPSTPDGTTISNTATVTSTTSDPNLLNNTATATTTVRAEADLSITKTDSPDPVRPGGSLTYTVSVTNGGPNAAASVTMNDPLPALTTFQSETDRKSTRLNSSHGSSSY